MVLNLAVMLGALGLAVDIGWSYFTKLQAQSAADAAAMAAAAFASNGGAITCGVNNVNCAGDTPCAYPNAAATDAFTTACAYAGANGFYNHGNQTVSVTAGTSSSGVTGNSPSYWVRATVGAKPYLLFGPFAGSNRFTINAASTAAVAYYSVGACVYVLDPTSSGALTVTGASSLTATCGVFINSNSSSALTVKGGATLTSTQILVNGGTSIANNSSVSPTPTTGAGTQTDPLASLSMPTFSNSCDFTNYSASSGATVTLTGGTYCGGITINGATVTFDPGLYILNGGGLSIGGNAIIVGANVTFFNTGQYGHTIAPVSTGGSASITLAAPGTGTYKGMLFLQDRNLTYTTSNNLAGGAGSTLTGTLYFPTTTVAYSGSTSTGSYTAMIAKNLSFTGTSNLKNDPTGFYTGLGTTVRGIIQ